MSRDIAAEIEKEYGQIQFKDPVIAFGYNKIEISQRFDLSTKIYLVLSLFPLFGLFYILNFSFSGFLVAMPFVWLFAFFYNYYNYFDRITIDFLNKELKVENRIRLVNLIRKFFKRSVTVSFQDISYFFIDDGRTNFRFSGRSYDFQMRKTSLFVKPRFVSPVTLANFRFEREARRLGELLQFYIVGKARIIE